jgi:hypothetical protein
VFFNAFNRANFASLNKFVFGRQNRAQSTVGQIATTKSSPRKYEF